MPKFNNEFEMTGRLIMNEKLILMWNEVTERYFKTPSRKFL